MYKPEFVKPVRFKLLTAGTPPSRGTSQSAGYDLCARGTYFMRDFYTIVPLGVAIEIPEGHVGLLTLRSSARTKLGLETGGLGIIDADYRGELMMHIEGEPGTRIVDGQRIAQLVIVPCVIAPIMLVEELSDTGRGEGGFGSTGV